jgi:hypothetical protein
VTLRQGDYGRDPLDILIERENASCKGCKHEITLFGERKTCATITRKWGKRCSGYQLIDIQTKGK